MIPTVRTTRAPAACLLPTYSLLRLLACPSLLLLQVLFIAWIDRLGGILFVQVNLSGKIMILQIITVYPGLTPASCLCLFAPWLLLAPPQLGRWPLFRIAGAILLVVKGAEFYHRYHAVYNP